MQYLLFAIGFALSCVAAFYSITGLAHIFVGAFYPVVIMGSTLEAAKLVGASWVFRNWKTAPRLLTGYVATGVLLLMLLTGIGTFGYLSRAYLVQQAPLSAMISEVQSAERGVKLAQDAYQRDSDTLTSFQSKTTSDSVVERLAQNDRLTGTNGAVRILREQQNLRKELQENVTKSGQELAVAESALAAVKQKTQEQSVDVGPLMFVAEAWYGETTPEVLNKVVVWFTLLIIFVFDPMAIALLLASQIRPPKQEQVFTPFVQRVDVVDPPSTMTTTTGNLEAVTWIDNETGKFLTEPVTVAPLTVNEGVAPLTVGPSQITEEDVITYTLTSTDDDYISQNVMPDTTGNVSFVVEKTIPTRPKTRAHAAEAHRIK